MTVVKSGFNRDDEWGFRALEPSRCCISSIALVLLKTGITHYPQSENKAADVDYQQMSTAQKLLLFWRKPAVRHLILFIFACGFEFNILTIISSVNVGGMDWTLSCLVVVVP